MTSGEPPTESGGRSRSGGAGRAACADLPSGDTSAMRARLTSNQFVGRVGELAELELAFAEAAAGRPTLVLLGGESGIGKTRLVGQFERQPAHQEAVILRGEGVDQGAGELPYAPLIAALRSLVRERHPAFQALSRASLAQLAALLPGLQDGEPLDERRDASAQLRLFEALLELFELLSEIAPVVLILEDMHWADRSTRTFVAFLARSLRQERLLILLTYRTDELHRRHPVRPLLAELERLDRVRGIELEPFDRDELSQVLADILGDRPSQELVERLFARSEGNPLYTEELLAAGLDGRGATPRSLRDAFMLRIERLSADAQRAARAIAAGRALAEATIAEVTGIEHEDLQAALRDAVAEQVLVADDDGLLRFRHALLREALYDDLLPGERSELHLALARSLEAMVDGAEGGSARVAATIAAHYAAAGDQPAALGAALRAARAAGAIRAYGDAADLAERALELWPRVPDAVEVAQLDHVEVLRLAARAHSFAGDRGRAEVLLESAVAELDPQADPRRYAALLARLARVQWTANRGREGLETAQRALAMLPDGEVSSERASLLAWLARTQHLRGRYREAERDGQEALAAAIAAGDRTSEAEVLNTLGMTQIVTGRVDDGAAQLWRAIEIARQADDLDSAAFAYGNLADALSLAGRTREALEIAREGLASTPARLKGTHEWLMMTVAELSFEVGDWAGSRAHLTPPPSRLSGISLIFRLIREADLALGEGDEDAAARCLTEVEPLVALSSQPQWIGVLGALLGELRRRRRELAGARAAVAETLDRIEVCTDDVARIAHVTAVGVSVEADFAQRGRDLREKREERDAVARGRIHIQRLRAAAAAGGPVEKAYLASGAAELARARGRSDPALWRKAGEHWEAIDRPYPVALARWREAEAYVEAGDRAAAGGPARAALEAGHRLGSRWLSDEVTALSERGRVRSARRCIWPRRPPASTCRGSSASSGSRAARRPRRSRIACTWPEPRAGGAGAYGARSPVAATSGPVRGGTWRESTM